MMTNSEDTSINNLKYSRWDDIFQQNSEGKPIQARVERDQTKVTTKRAPLEPLSCPKCMSKFVPYSLNESAVIFLCSNSHTDSTSPMSGPTCVFPLDTERMTNFVFQLEDELGAVDPTKIYLKAKKMVENELCQSVPTLRRKKSFDLFFGNEGEIERQNSLMGDLDER